MDHKAGYVNIIGKPNVGKSTLMNALVGEKISIITSKAQTTRHRILGIVNGEDFQIVFSDTPGIIKKPAYKMHEIMNQYIKVAFIDADLILYVVDITDKKIDEETTERIKAMDVPVFVLLNKIDLSNQEEVEKAVAYWSEAIPQATVFPISAKHEANIQYVLENIIQKLPECPPYFPKDELTDRSMRFFITEIIRFFTVSHPGEFQSETGAVIAEKDNLIAAVFGYFFADDGKSQCFLIKCNTFFKI